MEGLHLLSSLGAPGDSSVRVSRCGQGKGSLGLAAEAAEAAVPATRLHISGWMDGSRLLI